jgi:AcrR family transcriptional regulator
MADARTGEAAFLVNAVRHAVERSSIRDVAAQAGVSHGGLHNLIHTKTDRINGTTLRKLRAWYVRDWAARGESLTPEIAEYVLVEQVLAPVPANMRGLAVLELVRSLEQIYDSHDAPRPAWLDTVRDKC